MWYRLAKRALFSLDAEKAHDATLRILKIVGRTPAVRLFGKAPADPCAIMGLSFANRVGLAAGFDKNADFIDALAMLGFGFVEVGTVTPLPQPGNEKPRLFRIPERRVLINRMGFNNKGADYLASRLKARRFEGIVGVNIGKNLATPVEEARRDYLHCLSAVYPHADYVSVNVSSPNTPGLRSLQTGDRLARLLDSLSARRSRLASRHGRRAPLLLKIAPDSGEQDVVSIARRVNESDWDGVIAVNTTISRDGIEGHPLAAEAGGLSGAPLAQKARSVLAILKEALNKEAVVVASGGIMSPEDAARRVRSGADLVQLYSGLVFEGPGLVWKVSRELRNAKAR